MTVRRRRRGDRGAAAVEFALVVPVLVLLVLGIVDYGIYFSDSLALRHGIREGAREGVVKDFPAGCSAGQNVARVACTTEQRISAIGGDVHVRVRAEPSWREGNDVLVCAAVEGDAATGFTPLPQGGLLTNTIRMRIEQGPTVDAGTQSDLGGPPPGGWGWCT